MQRNLWEIISQKFIVLLIIPSVILGGVLYNIFFIQMKEELIKRNFLLSKALAGEVESYIFEPLNVLRNIADNIVQAHVKPDAINDYLATILSNYPFFESIHIIDPAGKIKYIAPYNTDFIGNNALSDRQKAFLTLGREKNKIFISPTFISIQSNKTTIALSMNFQNNVIVGYLKLISLQAIINDINLEGGYAFITDKNGVVVAHPESRYVDERTNLISLSIVRDGLKSGNDIYTYIDNNVDYIGCAFKIARGSLLVILTQPIAAMFGPLTKFGYAALIGILGIVCVSLLIARFTIRRTLQPLYDLTEATQKIADGNYNIQIDESDIREFQSIWYSFTEMMKAVDGRERELKKTMRYLDFLFNTQDSILVAVDADGIIERFNSAAVKSCRGVDITAGRTHIWQLFPYLKEQASEIKKTLTGPDTAANFKIETGTAKQKFYSVNCYSATFENMQRGLIRIDDITENKIQEKNLIQMQKMETVGTLAGGLAHDFNNFLGGLMAALSVLERMLDRSEAPDPKSLGEYIALMRTSTENAAATVDRLLTIARKKDPIYQHVDLNTVLEQVVKLSETAADQRVRIQAELTADKAYMYGDAAQIEQMFFNICINGIHAMTLMRENGEKWGGELNISMEQIQNDTYLHRIEPDFTHDFYYLITISDTGVGIDNQHIGNIFDPFFSTKSKDEGTGFGLSMAYLAAKDHGGRIKVYSLKGRGTTFQIYLPASKPTETTPQDDAAPESNVPAIPSAPPDAVILIMDDDHVLRSISKDILESFGLKAMTASGGKEGLAIFRKAHQEITAVLLDISMPDLSGDAVYLELKKINPAVKVLLTSGFSKDERVKRTLEAGADSFIHKPFTYQKLTRAILDIL